MGKRTFKDLAKGFYPTKVKQSHRRKQTGKNKKGQNKLSKGWFMTVIGNTRWITYIQRIGSKAIVHVKSC